ncbi:MAG: hypothetical protein HY542_05055 [Deltaproteobacteria bacterium]|nr:hypothetical protein [Deltaproteobacteria bacterium]
MFSSFCPLPWAPLAYSAEFHIYGRGYRLETEPLLKSGLCFTAESAGLEICFPEDGSIALDLLNPKLRRFIESESFLADLKTGPVTMSPGQAYFFLTGKTNKLEYLPDTHFDSVAWVPSFGWVSVLDTDVPAEKDAHREIVRRGFIRARQIYPGFDDAILFYEDDPTAFNTMALGNAYRDHPPTPLATVVDFVLRIFDPVLGTIHHGMAAFILESPDGPPRLEMPEETSRQIRSSVERHLVEIGRLKVELEKLKRGDTVSLMKEGEFLRNYLNEVEQAQMALEAGRLNEVEQWIKDHRQIAVYPVMRHVNFKYWDQEKAQVESGILDYVREAFAFEDLSKDPPNIDQAEAELTDYLAAFEWVEKALREGRVADIQRAIDQYPDLGIYFVTTGPSGPSRYPREKVLQYLLQRHVGVKDYFMKAIELFDEADHFIADGDPEFARQAFNEGVFNFKEGLRYVPEEMWGQMGRGKGPTVALGQLRREALLHLVSDAVGAHCRRYFNDACVRSVSANYFGLQPLHGTEEDLLLDTHDEERHQNKKAVAVTADILLYGVLTSAPDLLACEREKILDRFWPEGPVVPELPDGGIPLPGGVPDGGVP